MSVAMYYIDDDGDVATVDVRTGTLEVVTDANEGSVGSSSVEIDDPGGTFSIRGHRWVWFIESAATSDDYNGIIWAGFAAEREEFRGEQFTGLGRTVRVALKDLNEQLAWRIMEGNDAKRSSETDVARMQWLLATSEAAFIGDTTHFSTSNPVAMDTDETDYRGQTVRDIIDDCAQQAGKNWFLWNITQAATNPNKPSLWYGKDDPTTVTAFSSSLRISNVDADIDSSTTFAPAQESRLRRDPSRVNGGAHGNRDGGSAYVTRPQTIEDFAWRDGTYIAENVKTQAALIARLQRYLQQAATEEDTITTAIKVPPASVNGVIAGQRMQVKFSHFSGYTSFVWMRVYSRTVHQLASGDYELRLELVGDADTGSIGGVGAGTVCSDLTASGDFYPLGGPTPSGDPNPSGGNVFYLRPGLSYPIEPTPGHQGYCHFPIWGAGGVGTTDEWGNCCQNRVRCMVRGDGTMTIHTATNGDTVHLVATLYHHRYAEGEEGVPTSGVDVVDQVIIGNDAGADIEVEITTHGGKNCTHWVDVTDAGPVCGTGWGFDGFTWDAS